MRIYYIQQPTPSAVCFVPNEDIKVTITAKHADGTSYYWSYWDETDQIFSACYQSSSDTITIGTQSGSGWVINQIGDTYFAQKGGYFNNQQNDLSNISRVSVRNSWDISQAGVTGSHETVNGVHDGKITASGTELELMEYKLSTSNTYQEVGFGNKEISGLAPGTYDIRYAGREEKEAHTQITINQGEALQLDVGLIQSEIKHL